METLMDVRNLCVTYGRGAGAMQAVRNVSFTLGRERLGIVGESGSGKSTIGRALGDPDARVGSVDGSVGAAVAAFDRGASIFRVHDVRPHVEALALAAAVERGGVA